MSRVFIAIVIGTLMCGMLGCGGGSGGGGSSTFTVQDSATRFTAKVTTVAVGNKVQFLNVGSEPVQIVSGTLIPQGNSSIVHNIVIGTTGFSPSVLSANLGDTIQFSNNRGSTFVLDIVNDNGTLISTVTLFTGQQQTFDFPGAGIFIFQEHNNSLFRGSITLFGKPNPNGVFQTPVLNNGGTFLLQFNSVGSIDFYDLNQNNPNQSFKTGTINVQ